ncbi:hypothetical protein [Kibdelosporangium phytohabitans]|uniref:Uncharacterized protein n=1 Tax=Kibdelosporangium phytohabitans TaxID=860235 RepID=A0A0N7F2V4_9PSEU|nr:hypothetical protein [Kibdelosporangium phytohabitans]ALG06879.1 hypothetical protein AOZ06_07990 [Kibdelosporangium phytohabitans]MBE1468130.1 hypothetical protein [Kibdelosporangium phytohabitans]
MQINWAALGSVLLVSIVASLLVTVLFAVGIVAKGRGKLAMAYGSFAVCGAVTLLGIAVILA